MREGEGDKEILRDAKEERERDSERETLRGTDIKREKIEREMYK